MIIVDEQLPIVARVLGQIADVLCVDGRHIDRDLLVRTQANALFIRTVTRITPQLLDGTSVQFIASASAGIDHVDASLLGERGLSIVHAPGCNAQAVAEYVVAWLDHLQVPHESTIGIVGFGNVGSLVARYTRAMGMTVLVNDPPLADLGHRMPDDVTHVSLNELIERSHVITLHVPFTATGSHPTAHLLTSERLDDMLPGTLVINSSRGGIVDEQHLAALVSEGRLRAVLDVFDGEPACDVEVVRRIPFCTPHIAGYSLDAKIRASRMVLKAYRAWSGLEILIPEHVELRSAKRSSEQDTDVITHHPFRHRYLADPSAETFSECRRLTPLRSEHQPPPTWEELHVLRR